MSNASDVLSSGTLSWNSQFSVKNTFLDIKVDDEFSGSGSRPRSYTDSQLNYAPSPSFVGKLRTMTESSVSTVEPPVLEETFSEGNDTPKAMHCQFDATPRHMEFIDSPRSQETRAELSMPHRGAPVGPPGVFSVPSSPFLTAVPVMVAMPFEPMPPGACSDSLGSPIQHGALHDSSTTRRWADETPTADGGKRAVNFFANCKETAPRQTAQSEATTSNSTSAAPVIEGDEKDRTTVILRNLPIGCSRAQLLEILDSYGFRARYNFVYMPTDFKTWSSFGYAFVNFSLNSNAVAAMEFFHEKQWDAAIDKVCEAVWSMPHQGLEAHIERYRNSPVMHELVPDDAKPIIFYASGERRIFPSPTKRLKAPRLRN